MEIVKMNLMKYEINISICPARHYMLLDVRTNSVYEILMQQNIIMKSRGEKFGYYQEYIWRYEKITCHSCRKKIRKGKESGCIVM